MAPVLFALVGLTIPACATDEPAADPGDGAPVESDAADDDALAVTYPKVSQEVVDLVRVGGDVHVIVSLAATPIGGDDLDATKEAIAAAQQRVLIDLDGDGWLTRLAFENVPALAGTISGESALAVLDRHPDVISVDLDSGGGGDSGGN